MKRMRNDKILRGLGIFFALMLLLTLISKGIYASKLPQVTVAAPKKMAISHEVKATGSVKPARELAVNVKAGLRVREVFVIPGDRVEEGQLLFTLDTAYVQDLISQKELEAKKLELQIATLQNNLELAGEEKNRKMLRSLEDGAVALTEAEKRLERAKEDEEYAQRELNLYLADTPESEDEEEWKIWEEGRKALALKLQDAKRAREDAEAAQETAVREAGRRLQDDFSMENSDAALGVDRMEFSCLKEELEKLRSFVKTNGEIYAESAGTVTQVNVSAGESTMDSPAVVFADTTAQLQFEAILDREQKQYVEPGVEGSLSLGSFQTADSKAILVAVDYLTEVASMPGSFAARILLPEGTGVIGQSGTFVLNVQSESFPYCVAMDALYKDENQRDFVYVLEETDTILGTELVARRRIVNVLDSNGQYAALAPGVVDETDRIIESATEEFGDGDVVRMKD